MSNEAGLLAVFGHPDDLVHAIKKVRGLGLKMFEAYTPFPVHGLEQAMGLKRSWIPYATLVLALTGWCLGFYFQYWTMAVDWPVNVGGKPAFAWPAYIPITFESMVLVGGVLTAVILFAVCRLPNFKNRILDPRLTNDCFGLWIGKKDPRFSTMELNKIFEECDVLEVKQLG